MNNELPIPYTDYLYVKPVEKKLGLSTTLHTFGEILAVGPDALTKVGEYVAFELWDKPEFKLTNDITCHFVREKDVICKLPLSWVVAP